MFKRNLITINLLASKRFDNTSFGKLISWSLSVGKFVIFLSFILVMICFIYRFSLDQKISALNDSINQNVAVITSLSEYETKIRELNAKTSIVASISAQSRPTIPIVQILENTVPLNAVLSTISIKGNKMEIAGKTDTDLTFTNFINSLKTHQAISELVIDNLASGGVENPQITFSIILTLKPEVIKSSQTQ